MDPFPFLETFYASCCDGDWEHQYGVKIETLDNPGWDVHVDLVGAPLEQRHFAPSSINRSADGWIDCFKSS